MRFDVWRGLVVSALIALACPAGADVTGAQTGNGGTGTPSGDIAGPDENAAAMRVVERAAGRRPPKRAEGRLVEISYEKSWLDAREPVEGDAQWYCLAQAIYFEARGESVKGQFAVAEVILNRVDTRRYPETICRVVRQGTGEKFRCQFTYTCDGLSETIRDRVAFRRGGKIARIMMAGAVTDLTKGATHYHTRAVAPYWAQSLTMTTTIGFHHFYRRPTLLSSNE